MLNTLMIDIETTGSKPGCKVLSIGAFGFSKTGEQVEFYERISPMASQELALEDGKDTMEWWELQDESVKLEAFSGQESPVMVLALFKQFIYENFSIGTKNPKFTIWCCGSDFDFPILAEVFERTGVNVPWKFWQQRDYRTIKELFPEIKAIEANGEKHNALEDAKAQMRGLRYFNQQIKHRINV